MPFWLHQALEYALGAGLALAAVGMPGSGPIVLAGAVLIVAGAALTDGPLGGWSLLGRAAHRALDHALVLGFAAAPLLLGRHDPSLWILAECSAAALAVLSKATVYAKRPPAAESDADQEGTPGAARRAGVLAGQLARNGPRAVGRVIGRRRTTRPR